MTEAHDRADGLLEGFQLIGPDFRYRYVNDTVAVQARRTKNELLGRTMAEVFPGVEGTPLFAALREVMATGVPRQLENEFLYPDGARGWFDLRLEPHPEGVLVLSIDVTARKRAEDELRHGNRALAALGRCNQALWTAPDERQFAERVCALAVAAGYRMAWVGLTGPGEPGAPDAVRTLAAAGMDDGYAASVRVACDDSPRGRGPTGRAVRSGAPALARFIATDPDFEPWRQDALARGYASSMAAPFRLADATVGAVSIYAAEPDAFAPTEVDVLAELARDVGLGLQHLRDRRAARGSEELHRTLFERMSQGVVYQDAGGGILSANPAAERILGLSLAQLQGRTSSDPRWHALREDGSPLPGDEHPAMVALRTGREVRDFVMGVAPPTGEPARWISVSAVPQRGLGPDGPSGVFTTFTDVTDIKRAEDAVLRLNARLQRLARVVQDLSGAGEVAEVVDLVCRAARELVDADGAAFGLREGEECRCLGEASDAPLYAGTRLPLAGCVAGGVLTRGEPALIEDVSADPRVAPCIRGTELVKSLAVVPVGRTAPVGAISAWWGRPHRVTEDDRGLLQALADSASIALENGRALDRLRESELRYRTLVENVDDVVYALDAAGVFSYVSASMARFGFSPEDLVGQPLERLVHPDDRAGLRADLARTLAGQPEPYLFRLLDKAGEVRHVRTASRAVVSGGEATGVTGVLADLTAQRRAEEQLQASQKMEAVGRLAGGVAHDFNNLLTVILNNAETLLEAAPAGARQREGLLEIRDAGARAAALTRQLLAFSRRQVLEPRVLDLNLLAADLEKMLRRLIGEDVDFEMKLAPDLGPVRADPGQLEQVIMNLAVNARDAMPSGGKLTIESANVELDGGHAARGAAVKPGPYVLLAVTDQGCGMDAATLGRLFEPFFTTKEKGKGTGLGLPTVHGIVEQSGGHVMVHSEPGRGSTFEVYLPRWGSGPAPSPAPPAAAGPERGTETILLVEDEEAVRKLTARLLLRAGYQVLAAARGEEALALSASHGGRIHLLLTDVVMPGMSGRQLAEQLSAARADLRVLYMSGYTDDAIVHHGVLEHETQFLGKPFGAAGLARKVRETLDAPPR